MSTAPDERMSLLEMDTEPKAPVLSPSNCRPLPPFPKPDDAPRGISTRPGDAHVAAILGCTTMEQLHGYAQQCNDRASLIGKLFRSLPRAEADRVTLVGRAKRCALAWLLVWRSMCEAIARPSAPVAAALATVPSVTATEGSSFASIAAESTANANGVNLGDMAIGRASLGVGFTSAEGYLEALRRGVKRATCDEYTRILRTRYNVTVDFVVPILDEGTLPAGKGIAHTPTGPSVFDLPANHPDRVANRNRFGTRRAGARVAAPQGPTPLLRSGSLIAGAIASGQGALVSCTRGRALRGSRVGACDRASLVAALATIGRESEAPAPKSAAAQFGKACSNLNSGGLIARSAVRKDSTLPWPDDTLSRWIVGTIDPSANLDSLGDKALVADLSVTGQLRFHGSETLAARIRADYEARTGADSYTSTDLLAWFESTLRTRHHAVGCGAHLYVPGGQVEAVRVLIGAVKGCLARSVMCIPVTTESDLVEGLVEGLADEVGEISERFDRETQRARDDKRTNIGARMATTMLTELSSVRERVAGYAAMLGDAAVAVIKQTMGALDTKLRALTDDTAQRFAALDMN